MKEIRKFLARNTYFSLTCLDGGLKYAMTRENPCSNDPCGLNTECSQSGRQAVCRCLRGFVGSPYSRSNSLFFNFTFEIEKLLNFDCLEVAANQILAL